MTMEPEMGQRALEAPASEPSPSRVRLRLAARGYDRDEVDAQLVTNEQGAEKVHARLADIEEQLTETDQRAKVLEAKVSELGDSASEEPPESVRWLHDVTDQILTVTSDDARELVTKIENESKAEQREAERHAAEMMSSAEARAAEISAAARREQEEGARQRAESRQQVDLYVAQGKATAEEVSRAVWNEARGRIEAVRLERDRVEDKRRSVLDELTRVRSNLAELEGYLGRHRAEA